MARKFISSTIVKLIADIKNVSRTERHILLELSFHVNDDGKTNALLGINLICEITGYKRSCVIDSLKSLTEKGILKKRHRLPGCPFPDEYDLDISVIQSLQIDCKNINSSPKNKLLDKNIAVQKTDQSSLKNKLDQSEKQTSLVRKTDPIKNVDSLEEDACRHSSENPHYKKLLELGLKSNQIKDVLVIEETKNGYIETNLIAFQNYIKKNPEKNTVSMLVAYFKNNWGNWKEKSNLNGQEGFLEDSPLPKPIPNPKKPTIEELTAYWLRSAPEKRQIIYDEAKVVFTYLDYQLYGADQLSDEFVEHHAFLSMWGALHRTEYCKPKSNGILPSTLEPL